MNNRSRSVRTPGMEERVLKRVEKYPETSIKRIAATEGINYSLAWLILHEQLLHPHHLQRVQVLTPPDHYARLEFCQWLLKKCIENPQFTASILYTDEAGFTRDGIINYQNTRDCRIETSASIFYQLRISG